MYRSTWAFFVALAGIAGLWASVQALTLAGVLALFVSIGAGAACIGLVATKEESRSPWLRAVRLGIAWGAAMVAGAGLLTWLGIFGLVLVTGFVVLSPAVLSEAVGRLRMGRHGRTGPAGGGHDRSSDPEAAGRDRAAEASQPLLEASLPRVPWMEQPVNSMDDRALCLAWRTSYVALQRPLGVPLKLRIVQRRQQFLDELERRSPRGFSAWLAAGARAAGDPSRYMSQRGRADHDDQRWEG